MHINEIRRISLEYAKGHVKTGKAFRTPRVNQSKRRRLARQRTFAEWFADSLVRGKAAGPIPEPAKRIQPTPSATGYIPGDRPVDRPGKLPWEA